MTVLSSNLEQFNQNFATDVAFGPQHFGLIYRKLSTAHQHNPHMSMKLFHFPRSSLHAHKLDSSISQAVNWHFFPQNEAILAIRGQQAAAKPIFLGKSHKPSAPLAAA